MEEKCVRGGGINNCLAGSGASVAAPAVGCLLGVLNLTERF